MAKPAAHTPAPDTPGSLRSRLQICLLSFLVMVLGFAGGVGYDAYRAMWRDTGETETQSETAGAMPTAGSDAYQVAYESMTYPEYFQVSKVSTAATPAVVTPSPTPSPTPTPSVREMWPHFSPAENPTAVRRVAILEKHVALTFDDGPNPGPTRRIMETLEARGASATFFFIGKQAEQYPEIVRDAYRRGFEIGNHSYGHVDFKRISGDMAKLEIDRAQNIIADAGVPAPELIRFPYGNSTSASRRYCQGLGLGMIGWDIDTSDWQPNTTAQSILSNVEANLAPGSIILMHERPESTHEALPLILDLLAREGYTAVTVSQLLLSSYEAGQPSRVAAVPSENTF